MPPPSVSAQAQLSIEVTGAGANRIQSRSPISAVKPGVARHYHGRSRRSRTPGQFKLVEQAQTPLTEASTVDFGAARSRGADAVAAGSSSPPPTAARKPASGFTTPTNSRSWLVPPSSPRRHSLRAAGHRIADVIYEKLIGEPGIFQPGSPTW